MVLGELAPKNLAIARPDAVAKRLSRSTLLYLAAFGPVIRLFDRAASRLLRRIGIEPVEELPEGATNEDLSQIIATSRAGGRLSPEVSALLDRGLDFRGRTAAEVMVPRVDVTFMAATDSAVDVVNLLSTGHSRFPVRGATSDEILGIVAISDVLSVPPAERSSRPVSSLLREAIMIPSSLRLPQVLERLRAAHSQMACVVDEFGGFAGIVTFEDIAEELVGPIRDEDDLPEPAPVRQDDGSWLVPARWRLDEISDATGVDLPVSDDYDTVSGMVMARLGRVAKAGDSLQLDNLSVRVESVDRHVPQTVRLSR
jgi:CBS domain containing-hemolysin-like protein